MKKYCDWWLLPLLACLLAGCGDDDYHYPSVKLEFLTAFSGADGYLRSVVTDEGETLPVVEDKTKTNIEANASVRVISNYASEVTADGTAGAVLYALSGVLRQYAAEGIQKVMVHFSVHTYSGDIKTYDFVYNPD